MAKNVEILPYTELVERVREIARIGSDNDRPRARGAVNDVYVRKLPAEEDWTFFLASSAITCDAQYTTGTTTVNTQSATATFAGGASITSSMIGRQIKFAQNNDVYLITAISSSAVTISPILSGDVNISAGAFTIFNPYYALPNNFDRFPRNGGLLLYQGGRPKVLPEQGAQKYYANYNPTPGTPEKCRILQLGTGGVPFVEVTPPPSKAINLPYEYLLRPTILSESTGGTATVSASGGTVTFHAGALVAEATTGWYFRVNAFGTASDSEWYRIIALSIANSTATLQLAFGLSGATSAAYTLCAAPNIPAKIQPAILYGAITVVTADQNDPLFQFYETKYREIINDGKRTFKSRLYGVEPDLIFEEFHFRR